MAKNFFDEIEEDPKTQYHLIAILFLLGTILTWVYTAIPGQEKNAIIYIIFLIVYGFAGLADILAGKKKELWYLAINGLGEKWIQKTLFGAATALLLVLFVFRASIIQPFSIVDNNSILSFLFVVIAAPLVETSFFRGIFQPVATELINSFLVSDKTIAGIIAMIVQSAVFALYHINIFVGVSDVTIFSYVPYFIFGMIATFGVYYFRSISFEYGLHGANNLVAWLVR